MSSPRDIQGVRDLLEKVSQETTLWSNVYDLDEQKIYVSSRDSEMVVFELKNEMYMGRHGRGMDELHGVLTDRQSEAGAVMRPHFGYGRLKGEGIYHYGGRVLLPAGDMRKYGLEITRFGGGDDDFTAIGIVLEQRLYEWFNMSIGTIGYFNYGEGSDNVAGLTTNLGWEPDNRIPFKPFVTFRSDVIFHTRTDTVNSVSAGFAF